MNRYVQCDPNLCIGCGMCERRCIMGHYGLKVTEVHLDDPLTRQRCKAYRGPNLHVAVHCRHCENAPCMAVCPVGAITRRNDDMIFVDEERCIGCRECVLACPFGAVYLGPTKDGRIVATKCDLCVDVADEPQCVAGCPKKALRVMNDHEMRHLLHDKHAATVTQDARDVATPPRPRHRETETGEIVPV